MIKPVASLRVFFLATCMLVEAVDVSLAHSSLMRSFRAAAAGNTSSMAFAGGAAKAGDTCWGSTGTIGAFTDSWPQITNIYNIALLVDDRVPNPTPSGFTLLGWIYGDQRGRLWFQGYGGLNLGTEAGSIAFGNYPSGFRGEIATLAGDVFDSAKTVRVTVHHLPGQHSVHTLACFEKGWNGISVEPRA